MIPRRPFVIALLVTSPFFTSAARAQQKAAVPDNAPLVPRATAKVEKGRLTASVTLKGALAAEKGAEVAVRIKSWSSPLTVEQAVAHGTPVKKDDVLLTFDSEKITQAVKSAREERELARLTIKQAELELPLQKKNLPLDLQAAEREKKQSADDLQRFLKVEKPRQVEEAKFAVTSAEFNVETSKDELSQLEKMYRDKDLTEETEQMILKRYKHSLENAEYFLRGAQLRTERTLTIDLPRREEAAQLAATKADLAWDRAREQLPLQVRQKELALEKLRFDDNRAQEKLADLEKDLNLMTVKAPADGVVYYGRSIRGQWSGPLANAYLKGGTLPANDVLMTIVSPGKLLVYADADEKESAGLMAGQTARMSAARFPQRKLSGRVQRVASVPQGGKFEVVIALIDESPEGIVPGLTGSVKITTSQKDNVLTVPTSAVFDDPDNDTSYVYLTGPKPEKKSVKTGLIAGEKTEIVDGLSEGDEILTAKP